MNQNAPQILGRVAEMASSRSMKPSGVTGGHRKLKLKEEIMSVQTESTLIGSSEAGEYFEAAATVAEQSAQRNWVSQSGNAV